MVDRLLVPIPKKLTGVVTEDLGQLPIAKKITGQGWEFGPDKPPIVDCSDFRNMLAMAVLNFNRRGERITLAQLFGQTSVGQRSEYSPRDHVVFRRTSNQSFPSNEALARAFISSFNYPVLRVERDSAYPDDMIAKDPGNLFSGPDRRELRAKLDSLLEPVDVISRWVADEIEFIGRGSVGEDLPVRHNGRIDFERSAIGERFLVTPFRRLSVGALGSYIQFNNEVNEETRGPGTSRAKVVESRIKDLRVG